MFSAILNKTLTSFQPISLFKSPGTSVGGLFGLARDVVMRNRVPTLVTGTDRGFAGKACLRTNKSAAKRFIVRGGGRIKRGHGGRSHNTGHKGRKRINRLAASAPIYEKSIENRMRRLIRA
mmetsp:Transcript_30685/g.61809  ORF Transcript_30685/g.61809 Transcript_30685/m.61809 type:complete len:121 (-) Transcript_30685:73-435(-)